MIRTTEKQIAYKHGSHIKQIKWNMIRYHTHTRTHHTHTHVHTYKTLHTHTHTHTRKRLYKVIDMKTLTFLNYTP